MSFYRFLSFSYGMFIVGSGVYRYIIADSKNALWFGVVMGAFAIVGGALHGKKKLKVSVILELLVVVFVGGFFITKIMSNLEGDSLLRVLSLIIFSLCMGLFSILELKKLKN